MYMRETEIASLEMLAVAMSEEYRVRVVCNGSRACTSRSAQDNVPAITIPAVPLQDRQYWALLRGYVDHEVGHVRFTDQALLSRELLRALDIVGALKSIANMYEDLYVERLMGECFPGCRRNLRTFGAIIYSERRPEPINGEDALDQIRTGKARADTLPYATWTAITQYILYRVRSAAHPQMFALLPLFRRPVDTLAPGLARALEPLLASVAAKGTSTAANLALGRATLEVIQTFFDRQTILPDGCGVGETTEMRAALRWMFRNGGPATASVDIGRAAEILVEDTLRGADQCLLRDLPVIHHAAGSALWKERVQALSRAQQREALQAAAMMDAQMQALLQTYHLNRNGPMRQGKLNTNTLYKLFTCSNNIFSRHTERRKIHTEIVLCIDMSGSMQFNDKAILASMALYSVAVCLQKLNGIVFSMIGFCDDAVVDIVRSRERVSSRMRIIPAGGTRCGGALRHAIQRLSSDPRARRIVIMLTDGDANDGKSFREAIARARTSGIEFLGLGIQDAHILQYLPEDECCVIRDLRLLAPEILRLLRKKLKLAG